MITTIIKWLVWVVGAVCVLGAFSTGHFNVTGGLIAGLALLVFGWLIHRRQKHTAQ